MVVAPRVWQGRRYPYRKSGGDNENVMRHQWPVKREFEMMEDYPNDSDGDALRFVVESGSDMSKPMYIEFQVAMPGGATAKLLAEKAKKLGYRTKVYHSEGCNLPWTCECSTRMLATHESVLAIQAELARLSAPLDGFPDGWGTFGNGPNGQPDVE